MRYLIIALSLIVLVASPALAATTASANGAVRGLNTVDNVFASLEPGTYSYTLRATGNGTNRLKLRVYVWDSSIDDWRWQRVHTARISPSRTGATYTSTFGIGAPPGAGSTPRSVKLVFSRKVGTSRIDYVFNATRN